MGADIGADIGATLLEVTQANVSFSYSDTYSETTSADVQYGVTINNGQSGCIDSTPTYKRFDGSFSGSNCRAAVDEQGESAQTLTSKFRVSHTSYNVSDQLLTRALYSGSICVPRILDTGLFDGTISFVGSTEFDYS